MRDIHSDTLAAIVAGGFHPALLVRVDWPEETVRAHTGFGDLIWGGETWRGVGPFGAVDIPADGFGDAVPAEMALSILGTLEGIFGEMDKPARNHDVDVHWALTTEAQGNVLIGDPVPLMIGYVDSNEMAYQDVGEGQTAPSLSVGVNSGPSVRMPLSATHSLEEHQATYQNDTFFRHSVYSEAERFNPRQFPE